MSESFTKQAQSLDEQAYQALKSALELGKWPNGERLLAEQKELCMETIISYEARHLPEDQRTGYIPPGCKSQQADVITTVQKD